MSRADLLAKLEEARAEVHYFAWRQSHVELAAAETRRDEAERELREFDQSRESAELDFIDATISRSVPPPLYNVDIEHRLAQVEATLAAWGEPEADDEVWYDPAVCIPNGQRKIMVRNDVGERVLERGNDHSAYYEGDEYGGWEPNELQNCFTGWRPVNEDETEEDDGD